MDEQTLRREVAEAISKLSVRQIEEAFIVDPPPTPVTKQCTDLPLTPVTRQYIDPDRPIIQEIATFLYFKCGVNGLRRAAAKHGIHYVLTDCVEMTAAYLVATYPMEDNAGNPVSMAGLIYGQPRTNMVRQYVIQGAIRKRNKELQVPSGSTNSNGTENIDE